MKLMSTHDFGLSGGRAWACAALLIGLTATRLAAGAALAEYTSAENNISFVVIEADSGFVIAEHNADEVRAPASMVKMMQMLLVAEGVAEGDWTLDKELTASARAAAEWGSQVYLQEGEVWPLAELMQAVAVRSANDGAVMVAEGLWGSEEAYLERMNERAAELGMDDTEFFSVNGLPPTNEDRPHDRTTAQDMARLAQECLKHPIIMEWVGTRSLDIDSRRNDHRHNTNRLLTQMKGCDGFKTGYTRAAGYCVTATAEKDGTRLIAVVMGFKNANNRFGLARYLMEQGFQEMRRLLLLAENEALAEETPVNNSTNATTRLKSAEDLWVNVHMNQVYDVELVTRAPERLQAPMTAGTIVGDVRVELNGEVLAEAPLKVGEDLEEAGWRWKITHTVMRGVQAVTSIGAE
ncbi:MAG: D-alanyl-D-alanine carboxypeptidase family protein [Candidatus Hydrogenedentota bacterium]